MVELHFEREGLFPLMIVFWFEYSLPRIDLGTEGHGGTRRDTAKSLGTGSEGGRQCSIIDIRERDLPLGGRSGSCQIGFYEPDGRSSVMAEGTPAPSRSPVRARQIRIPAALPNYRELLRKLILTTSAREI